MERETQNTGEIVTSIFRSHNLRQCIRRLFDFFSAFFFSFSLTLTGCFNEINSILFGEKKRMLLVGWEMIGDFGVDLWDSNLTFKLNIIFSECVENGTFFRKKN